MIFKIFTFGLAAFEVPQLIRLFVFKHNLHDVNGFFSKEDNNNQTIVSLFSGFLAVLIVVRIFAGLYPNNRSILHLASAIHALEIPLFGSLFLRNALPNKSSYDAATWGMMHVVGAFILADPFVFLGKAMLAAGKKKIA